MSNSLTSYVNTYDALPSALVYVHVQDRFCNPDFSVATHDRASLTAVAHKIAAVDRIVAQTDTPRILLLDRNREGGNGPYKLPAQDMTAVLATNSTNGFSTSALDTVLEESGIANIKIVGVARSACVLDTALKGVASGYNVEVIDPLTADYAHNVVAANSTGAVRFHAEACGPGEVKNLRQVIWRCDASHVMPGPTLHLDIVLREAGVQEFDGDRIVSAFHMSSRENAENAARKLTSVSVGNLNSDGRETIGVDHINISSDDDEHVVVVSMTDHTEVKRSVESLIGRAHSYILVPCLNAA